VRTLKNKLESGTTVLVHFTKRERDNLAILIEKNWVYSPSSSYFQLVEKAVSERPSRPGRAGPGDYNLF
jgi:hypothetical protein